MAADGYDPERLTDTAGGNDHPAWSSDGTMIAFENPNPSAAREIYVMEHDGDNEVNLTDDPADDMFPSFFPGQRKIAFSSNRDGDNDIYALTFDASMNTTGVVQITTSGTNTQPTISPNGKKIAFISSRDGDEEIWRMRADGTNPVNLTNNTPANDFRPSWQPIP